MQLEFTPYRSSKNFLADLAHGLTQSNQGFVKLSYLLGVLNSQKIVLSPSDVAFLETFDDRIPVYYLLNPEQINRLGPQVNQINPFHEASMLHYMENPYRNLQKPLRELPEKYMSLHPNIEFAEVVVDPSEAGASFIEFDESNAKSVYNHFRNRTTHQTNRTEDGYLTEEVQTEYIPEGAYDLTGGWLEEVAQDYNLETKHLPDNNSFLQMTPKYNMNTIKNIKVMNLDRASKITPLIITHLDGTVERVTYNTRDLGPDLINRGRYKKKVNFIQPHLPNIPSFNNITELLNIYNSDRLSDANAKRLLGEVLFNQVSERPDLFGSNNELSLQQHGGANPANNQARGGGEQLQRNNQRDALAQLDPEYAKSLRLMDEAFRAGDSRAYTKVLGHLQGRAAQQRPFLSEYINSKIPTL